ncbi:C15C7.7 [Symbiodinium sp. CCMP2592]|nr:C15C7.7 [Symbiodinium sp. CCMP2592]
MAFFLHLFASNVPEHVEEEVRQTGKGKLEVLYGSAMQANKAALEAEAEKGLHSPASPLDPQGSAVSSPEKEAAPPPQEPELIPPEARRRRRRSSDMHLPEVYIAASPVDASSPGAEEPELDYFSKTNPDCYNPDGEPMRKPRWRPERAWDTPSATESDKEFESDSESSSSSEEDFDDKESLACLDLESAAAMRAIEIQAASPRVSLHRASDKPKKKKKSKAHRHHQQEQPRQDPMERSAGAPEMQMGQATMEQMPEAAPKSAQGWLPTCTCSMKMARDCTENLLCCCSEGARKVDVLGDGGLGAEELEKGLLGRLYKVSRRRRVLPSNRTQRAS